MAAEGKVRWADFEEDEEDELPGRPNAQQVLKAYERQAKSKTRPRPLGTSWASAETESNSDEDYAHGVPPPAWDSRLLRLGFLPPIEEGQEGEDDEEVALATTSALLQSSGEDTESELSWHDCHSMAASEASGDSTDVPEDSDEEANLASGKRRTCGQRAKQQRACETEGAKEPPQVAQATASRCLPFDA